jgi:ribonuclease HII
MRTRLGIDEAGRGCVLGPLVFGALLVDEAREHELRTLGARDSKKLSRKRREALRDPLAAASLGWTTVEISPAAIDAGNLARLGEDAIVALVERFTPTVVVLDAPVPPRGIPAFVARLRARGLTAEIVAENRADDTHPCCSAASVFAKTVRDGRLAELEERAGVPRDGVQAVAEGQGVDRPRSWRPPPGPHRADRRAPRARPHRAPRRRPGVAGPRGRRRVRAPGGTRIEQRGGGPGRERPAARQSSSQSLTLVWSISQSGISP